MSRHVELMLLVEHLAFGRGRLWEREHKGSLLSWYLGYYRIEPEVILPLFRAKLNDIAKEEKIREPMSFLKAHYAVNALCERLGEKRAAQDGGRKLLTEEDLTAMLHLMERCELALIDIIKSQPPGVPA